MVICLDIQMIESRLLCFTGSSDQTHGELLAAGASSKGSVGLKTKAGLKTASYSSSCSGPRVVYSTKKSDQRWDCLVGFLPTMQGAVCSEVRTEISVLAFFLLRHL